MKYIYYFALFFLYLILIICLSHTEKLDILWSKIKNNKYRAKLYKKYIITAKPNLLMLIQVLNHNINKHTIISLKSNSNSHSYHLKPYFKNYTSHQEYIQNFHSFQQFSSNASKQISNHLLCSCIMDLMRWK